MSQTQFKAFACKGKGEPLEEWEYMPRPLGDNDVEISISHCGICGSDIHTLDSGWGPTMYPVVVGHEIVGKITAKGSAVSNFTIGDVVGVGAQCFACLDCSSCHAGCDQNCPQIVYTYNSKYADGSMAYGGYANAVRLSANYAFKIPVKIKPQFAAPLLCAGITTYSPLKAHYQDGMTVGVVGIGGLGHLALQWASKAFKARKVFALSSSENKRNECLTLGATDFVHLKDESSVKAASNSVDLLLVCSSAGNDWDLLISFLACNGKIVLLAIPEEPVNFNPIPLVFKTCTLTTSKIGPRNEIIEMLQVAAETGVEPMIETLPMTQANEGVKRVRDGKARYRVVLVSQGE